MLRVITIALAVAVAAVGMPEPSPAALQAQDAEVRFAIARVNAEAGAVVEIPITASGVTSPALSVFNIAVEVDSRLEVTAVRGGDAPWTNPIVNMSGQQVRIAGVNSRGASGDFTLAVLVLRVSPRASGELPVRMSSASAVGVNASVLRVQTAAGAAVVGGATTPPPTATEPAPPPPPAPTSPAPAPPSSTPAPPPSTPAPPPSTPATPEPESEEQPAPAEEPGPTETPAPVQTEPPPSASAPAPLTPTPQPVAGGEDEEGLPSVAWPLTFSLLVSPAQAAGLDELLGVSGVQARTSPGALAPAYEDGRLIYRLPVSGMTREARLNGPFEVALGGLQLSGTGAAGQATMTFGGGAGLTAEAALVPDNDVLSVELVAPRLWLRSGVMPRTMLDGERTDAGRVAFGLETELLGVLDGTVFMSLNGDPQDREGEGPVFRTGTAAEAETAFTATVRGLDGIAGATFLSLWAEGAWHDANTAAGKQVVIARVANGAVRMEPAQCDATENGLVGCAASFEDSPNEAEYALLAVRPEGSARAESALGSEGAAFPGVLLVLMAVGALAAALVWLARVVSIVRRYNG